MPKLIKRLANATTKKNIPIIIPGFEDSTMGNIFESYTYTGKYRADKGPRLPQNIMKSGLEYMHFLYDWYQDNSKNSPIAFLPRLDSATMTCRFI